MEKEELEQASLEEEKWRKKNYWVKESTIDRIRYWNDVRNDKNEGYTVEALLDFYEKNHSQEQQAMEELLTLQRQQMTIIREAEMNSKLNQQLLNTMMWFHEIEGFQAMDSLPLIEAKKQYQELLESQIKTAHHRKKYNQVGDD